MMHTFTVNYRDDLPRKGMLLHRGYFAHDLPRLIPVCRLAGHRPVVDGHGTPGELRGHVARWVCCDRCGVRPEPQGRLDPERWSVGERYAGPWDEKPHSKAELVSLKEGGPAEAPTYSMPGPWPTKPTGELAAEVVIGRSFGGFGVSFTLGCAGSENTLSASVRVDPIGAIYVHTQRFGTWLQRRLNGAGYEDKQLELSGYSGSLHWKLWADDNGGSRKGVPRWRNGSVRVDPRDLLLGERRYGYTDVGDPVPSTVRMPHGDDHAVILQLQRQTYGRARGRKRLSWTVHWGVTGDGIPTEPGDRGRTLSSGVAVSDAAVKAGTWPHEAAAAIAARMTGDRTDPGYKPALTVRSSCPGSPASRP